jgi:hypothetical protein
MLCETAMYMKSKYGLFLASICFIIATSAQDKRAKIKDHINEELIIEDNWAGQSITLIKENRDYYIRHKIFGSGIPVIDSAKYEVEFRSAYQLTFSAEISRDTILKDHKNFFLMAIGDQGLCLYVNGLKVVTRQAWSPAKS